MPSNLTKFAKKLRKNSTKAETLLWNKLRSRQLEGIKFRRQQPIDNYIVDFVCFEKRIMIELDGGQHAKEKKKDQMRDKDLTEKGFTVLRFWNNDVLEDINAILELIRRKCQK